MLHTADMEVEAPGSPASARVEARTPDTTPSPTERAMANQPDWLRHDRTSVGLLDGRWRDRRRMNRCSLCMRPRSSWPPTRMRVPWAMPRSLVGMAPCRSSSSRALRPAAAPWARRRSSASGIGRGPVRTSTPAYKWTRSDPLASFSMLPRGRTRSPRFPPEPAPPERVDQPTMSRDPRAFALIRAEPTRGLDVLQWPATVSCHDRSRRMIDKPTS